MKLQIFFLAILCVANTALAIKCFTNNTNPATSTTCPTTDTACARISSETGGKMARLYSCVATTVITAANTAGFPTVTDSLVCKNLTATVSGKSVTSESCYCKADNCNDPAKGATTAAALKCYKGTEASKAVKDTTCGTGEDRCFNQTKDGKVESKCFKLADLDNKTMTDNACKTESDVKTCLCKTDNCNNPSGTAGPITQSLFQVFVIIVFSSILRLGMS